MPTPRPSDRLALVLGQWFGCGRSPVAPGTVGSLGAVPLFFALREVGPGWYWAVTAFITLSGFWASERCAELLADKDPSSVVIDEVAGVLIAMGMVAAGPFWLWLIAWLSFRLFDITKPWLIDRVQHLRPPGVGIMMDDLLAGGVAGGLAWGAGSLLA